MDRLSPEDPIRAALARDDPVAVELIWDRCARDLFGFLQAALRSRQDAEDVLQAVFVRIVRKRRRLAKADCLDAYVYQIARNEAASFLRRRRRPRANVQDDSWLALVQEGNNPTDLAEELQAALDRLPWAQREVVVLKVYRDKTKEQVLCAARQAWRDDAAGIPWRVPILRLAGAIAAAVLLVSMANLYGDRAITRQQVPTAAATEPRDLDIGSEGRPSLAKYAATVGASGKPDAEALFDHLRAVREALRETEADPVLDGPGQPDPRSHLSPSVRQGANV